MVGGFDVNRHLDQTLGNVSGNSVENFITSNYAQQQLISNAAGLETFRNNQDLADFTRKNQALEMNHRQFSI